MALSPASSILGFLSSSTANQHHNKESFVLPVSESSDKELVFFVIGDWGRQGNLSQLKAAALMDEVASIRRPNFIVSTGDNFYPHGLNTANDVQIKSTFLDVYDSKANASSLRGLPWYSVLGNHDYGDTLTSEDLTDCDFDRPLDNCSDGCCHSPDHQVSTTNSANLPPQWTLTRGASLRSFPAFNLDLIFIDTNPFISRYHMAPWASIIGGISSQDRDILKAQVEERLQSSTASIKIVVGHHPVHSRGGHCTEGPDCKETSEWLSPLLKRYNVTAYLAGHDHDIQHIKKRGDLTHYIVSGAGSDIRFGEFNAPLPSQVPPSEEEGEDFFWGGCENGFLAVVVGAGLKGRSTLALHFYTTTAGEEHGNYARPRIRHIIRSE